jgi:RHS repeat-associated protein
MKRRFGGRGVGLSLFLFLGACDRPARAPDAPRPPEVPSGYAFEPGTGLSAARLRTVPSESELYAVNALAEPLLATRAVTPDDNRAVAAALKAFERRTSPEDVSALTTFLEQHPSSPWRASVETNLGIFYYGTGHFSRAVTLLEQVWDAHKGATTGRERTIADRALGTLAELSAKLGRRDELKALFAEIEGRDLSGPATVMVQGARDGLGMMEFAPNLSFRCGPLALENVFRTLHPGQVVPKAIEDHPSTTKGTSLDELATLAARTRLSLQMAKRPGRAERGAGTAPSGFAVPAVVHWRSGHFAAILKKTSDGRYLVQDPTFGRDVAMTAEALDDEASGYYLVPSGALPAGWKPVSSDEGRAVWGKGIVYGLDKGGSCKNPQKCRRSGGCSQGGGPAGGGASRNMPTYSFHSLLASLHIEDAPVGYEPPVGTSMLFGVQYNHREADQPALFNFSNLGAKWSFDFLSYVTDTPGATSSATVYLRGGGTDSFASFDTTTNAYYPNVHDKALLVRISANSYELRQRDGSKEVFSMPDGATSFPRKVFLTAIVDAAGNTTTLTYDGLLRLTTITDPLGKATTLSYGLTTDPYKITSVADPYGRTAAFSYVGGRLSQITDSLGMTSAFTYGADDLVTAMTTPYGTTTFAVGTDGAAASGSLSRWIEATDPANETERLEYRTFTAEVPVSEVAAPSAGYNGSLHYRNSFFWDKEAWKKYKTAPAATKYDKAYRHHWLHTPSQHASIVLESERGPLTSRIWYRYPGQVAAYNEGTSGYPSQVIRLLAGNVVQSWSYEYNDLGNVTKTIDPLGRVTRYDYAANQIDVTGIFQKVGTEFQRLAAFSNYGPHHRPGTIIDASGQVTTAIYNTRGQLTAVTNPKGETVTFEYGQTVADPSYGRLVKQSGPLPGNVYTIGWDSAGRPSSVVGPSQYAVTRTYDAGDRPRRTTYPDGSYKEITYDRQRPVTIRDRAGRITTYHQNALGQYDWIADPALRSTQYEYCGCGAMKTLVDPEGRSTSWTYDDEGRVIEKKDADGGKASVTYDLAGQIAGITDRKGVLRLFTYHLDGRLNTDAISATGATEAVQFTWDPDFPRVTRRTDSTGITQLGYYPIAAVPELGAGRLAAIDGPLTNDLVAFRYDSRGDVDRVSVNGVHEDRARDALGRLGSTVNALGTFTYGYAHLTNNQLLTVVNKPNGETTQYAYYGANKDFRLNAIMNMSAAGLNQGAESYVYDAKHENILYTFKSNDPQLHAPGVHQLEVGSHTYDLAGQLSLFRADVRPSDALATVGPQLEVFDFRYDKAGNMTSRSSSPGPQPAQTSTFAVNALNQITSATSPAETFLYDLNGNRIADLQQTYEWDRLNRLTAVNRGTGRTELTYDGLGRFVRIVEKNANAIVADRRYLWSGDDLVEERDATGAAVVKRFFHEGFEEGGVKHFYARDRLGSITSVTNAAQAVLARYSYDPHGVRRIVSGTKAIDLGFAGYFHHAPSGLYLMRHRAYDPRTGRFLSRDPIGVQGGNNLYAYVGNNPANATDRSGLCIDPVTMTACAAAAAPQVAVGVGIVAAAAGGLIWNNTRPADEFGEVPLSGRTGLDSLAQSCHAMSGKPFWQREAERYKKEAEELRRQREWEAEDQKRREAGNLDKEVKDLMDELGGKDINPATDKQRAAGEHYRKNPRKRSEE